MIRVIIERNIKAGCLHDYLELVRAARRQANKVDGFIAGELLQAKDNPLKAIIISSWESHADWENWAASEERLSVLDNLKPLLEQEESITVLENSQLSQ